MSTQPESLPHILRSRFGFAAFRPHQEEICQTLTTGRDALVVMPTGAGKSLCYQVPGLARPGPALVISPLVALIEDQTQQLQKRGIKADRIHSGRDRETSRQTFRAYLRKELEFLFIAPERLAVPGFAEMLRNHPPSLIAIDEAHCISEWGHDFRPDYRLVGERLEGIPGTPLVALTATATPKVQDDIISQLRLRDPARFIHGFRRANIAVRVLERSPKDRLDEIAEILSAADRLPAIVYAPTRKKAEELVHELKGEIACAAYHAGLASEERDRVQTQFLSGRINLIVATVAFGMGIDKSNVRTVIHAGIPSSVEGYYQEIGRAGRDGKPSEAYLLHSFSDRKMHDFFLENDYPEATLLSRIAKKIPQNTSISRAELLSEFKGDRSPDMLLKAMEKLVIHGGARSDRNGNLSRGVKEWKRRYEKQRQHRIEQLEAMQKFTEISRCRMLQLIQHFGDPTDSGKACGHCDRCSPTQHVHVPSEKELQIAQAILACLAGEDDLAVGRLFEEVEAMDRRKKFQRQDFEKVLSALSRAGLVDLSQAEFEKNGRTISYRRVAETRKGRSAPAEKLRHLEIEGRPSQGL